MADSGIIVKPINVRGLKVISSNFLDLHTQKHISKKGIRKKGLILFASLKRARKNGVRNLIWSQTLKKYLFIIYPEFATREIPVETFENAIFLAINFRGYDREIWYPKEKMNLIWRLNQKQFFWKNRMEEFCYEDVTEVDGIEVFELIKKRKFDCEMMVDLADLETLSHSIISSTSIFQFLSTRPIKTNWFEFVNSITFENFFFFESKLDFKKDVFKIRSDLTRHRINISPNENTKKDWMNYSDGLLSIWIEYINRGIKQYLRDRFTFADYLDDFPQLRKDQSVYDVLMRSKNDPESKSFKEISFKLFLHSCRITIHYKKSKVRFLK